MLRQKWIALGRPQRKAVVLVAGVVSIAVLALGVVVAVHRNRRGDTFNSGQATLRPTGEVDVSTASSIPAMLEAINAQLDLTEFPFSNAARSESLRQKLERNPASGYQDEVRAQLDLATELLNAGKTREALTVSAALVKKARGTYEWRKRGSYLLTRYALASLRLGEEQNCCAINNERSCLLPIRGKGVHSLPEGARGAVKILREALAEDPENVAARWLLNIAHMTLGEYPRAVPDQWLIPLERFGAVPGVGKFPNVAQPTGLDIEGLSGSIVLDDFEDRGLLDMVISNFDRRLPLRYMRNNGDGTFTERKNPELAGQLGGLNMISTDYNNDGRLDVIVLRGGWFGKFGHYPLTLMRNDGNGRFTDVTIEAGLVALGPTQTAVSFDYNSDGFLDLFIGRESPPAGSSPAEANPCKLYRNNGNGKFTDVTEICGLGYVRFVKGVAAADFTRTGRPGLYLSCMGEPGILLRNDGPAGPDKSPMGPWKFTNITDQAGMGAPHSSFSCFFFDYDNDGWEDLYSGGYAAVMLEDVANDYLGRPTRAPKSKLYRNNGDGTFTNIAKQVNLDKVILGMGLNFGDLDNDGWLDFYAATGNPDLGMLIPNRMFRNNQGKRFDEVTTTGDFGHLQKGHGVAFGDIRNNGQQDVFLIAGGAFEADTAHSCLFANPGTKNHWLQLKLTGSRSNRIALGAEICVTLSTPSGERKVYRTVSTGGSFGNNPLRQTIGLADATSIKQVDVRWPATGCTQSFRGLAMDRTYRINEASSAATEWKLPRFNYPGLGKPILPDTRRVVSAATR